jgi:Rrf2 family protein
MKLTHACGYAVRAVAYLARQKENRLVTSRDIARAQGLPERFLVKVLKPLVSARLLVSLRGPNGGYRLARSATAISLLEIVEAVDGPILAQVPALAARESSRLDRRLEAVVGAAAHLIRLRLGKVRVADLVGRG